MSNIAVRLTNVSKKYTITHQKPTLVENVLSKKVSEEFFALKNINLTIKKGEKVGIIGPNGAGKTTLLKVIAGITVPTTGKVETCGKVVALISLDAGFHPELTGEENIYLNGMIVGMTRAEIKEKFKKIVTFADIKSFLDAPFYTYSEGMKFRLAFSLAMANECEILVMDEIFISGDIDFQKKTSLAIRDVQEKKKITTIVCSHIPLFVWGFSDNLFEINTGILKPISRRNVLRTIKSQDKEWKKSIKKPLS